MIFSNTIKLKIMSEDMDTSPFARVGDKCSLSPILSIKSIFESIIDRGC